MAQQARRHFTFEEYLALEEVSRVRHEYLGGQVRAMASGSPDHAAICVNISTLLSIALRGKPCGVFSADLRVRVQESGLGTYPDVTVVCGALALDPEDKRGHTAVNPRVVVEVLSPSTEDYDRGEKLGLYQTIRTLEEIVLVAHDRHEIEVVRREPDGTWSRHSTKSGEARLASCDVQLPLVEVYRNPFA